MDEVALGTASGASGRIGLRGRWTIVSDSGQVWQPYERTNLWRDWGARATAIYSGVDLVPLLEQANRLQLGGGVSVRMNVNVSLYANADYQLSVGDTDGGRRDGIRGAAGVRLYVVKLTSAEPSADVGTKSDPVLTKHDRQGSAYPCLGFRPLRMKKQTACQLRLDWTERTAT